jgi:hypothetical protein
MPIIHKYGTEAELLADLSFAEIGVATDTDKMYANLSGTPEQIYGEAAITARLASQAEAEAGTDNTKIMTSLRTFQQTSAKSAPIAPTVGGNATTRTLTLPAGTNPTLMAVRPGSAVSASSAITAAVTGGSAYTIKKPDGTSNLLSMKSGVVYILRLDAVPATPVYICENYLETLTQNELGGELFPVQTSWSPTLSGATTAGSPTYGTRMGYYVKSGRLVFCQFRMPVTALGGAAGDLRMSLPITPSAAGQIFMAPIIIEGWGGLSTTADMISMSLKISPGSNVGVFGRHLRIMTDGATYTYTLSDVFWTSSFVASGQFTYLSD